jgi:DNA primase
MARYTDDSRERVRDAVDFVDLVGSRVELRKAGVRRYTGLCPFHDERSPSFGIDPLEKLYHCFGCGEGGDVFKWVMEIDHVSFGEALEILADRYNVALERTEEDPRAAERRERDKRLMALLERAAAYYVRLLWESPEAAGAREYLASRGLSEAVAREFRVGFSPEGWDRVVVGSQRSGFTEAELLAVGLAQRSRGRTSLIDRFRGRLMFPWADPRGRVLGFGARALADDQQPKYLNTAETTIFSKGSQVYGADLARVAAAKLGAVVLVEGYTDVLALHQAGARHTVGQQGTALTKDQATALTRLAPRIVLCLDADSAGQQAMLKAASVVRSVKADADLRVVALPPGSDPADVAQRESAEAVEALLAGAVPFARWQVEHALAHGDVDTSEGRDALLADTGRVIRGLPPGILRQELVRLVADKLGLNDALIAASLAEPAPRRPGFAGSSGAGGGGGPGPRRDFARSGADRLSGRGGGSRFAGRERPSGVPAGVARGGGAGGSPPDHGGAVADDFGRIDDPGGGPGDDAALDALISADPGREGEEGTPARGPAPAPASGPQPVAPLVRAAPAPSSNPALQALDRRAETELAFLALCVALPAVGARRLAETDLETLFSSATVRRAAEHLRTHTESPSSGLPPEDDALAGLIAELVLRAGRIEEVDPAELDRASLMLELARLDRDISAARASRSPLSELAAERQRVLGEIRKVSR